MANNNISIDVNVNFNDVSYDPVNGWSGWPIWDIEPSPARVNPVRAGDTNTIRWNLNASAVVSPFTASFANASAITFSGTPGWTGGNPVLVDSQHITASDTFSGLPSAQNYYYSITVTLSGMVNGTQVTQTYTLDPDVQNESGTTNAALTRA